MTPHPSQALFFYLGVGVGTSWLAWQGWGVGPFASAADVAREVRLAVEPPAPIRLELPLALEGGEPTERLRAQTWWVPSARGADLERAAEACASGRSGGIPVGGFAVIDVAMDGVRVAGERVLELEEGVLADLPPVSGLVPPLAVAVDALRLARWEHHSKLGCPDVDPERVLLVVEPSVPPDTRDAVERTLCLAGVRADRPLSDSRARRRVAGVRQHEWELEGTVPVVDDLASACDVGLGWAPMTGPVPPA